MTSSIIESLRTHSAMTATSRKVDVPECAFCQIISHDAPAYKVYENEWVVAILDILPLRPGHVLVIPKVHVSRLSELPPEFAGATGEAVSKVANAITKALDNTALNVVCNQEYAQVIPHVHYHIIPAPNFTSAIASPAPFSTSIKDMHRLEFEARSELDDDDAEMLSQKIRSKL